MTERVLIQQGAEAKLEKYEENGVMVIEKIRFEKKYRHPLIDQQVRKRRTKSEAKCLQLAQKSGIPCPEVIAVEPFSIKMEYIDGKTLTKIYGEGQLTPALLK